MTDDPIEYTERAVAFVDILGFKNHVAALQNDDSAITNLHRALRRIKIIEGWTSGENTFLRHLQVSTFSDCIAISGTTSQLPELILTIGYLQADLLLGGILTRGGIATGLLHHKAGMVYGDGLVAAHEMEQKVAVVPRVIVADKLVTGLRPKAKSFLKQDTDGHWYVDFFSFEVYVDGAEELAADGWDPRALYFEEVREKLANQLEHAAGSERIIAKLKWVIRRFNEALPGQKYARCSPIVIDA
jgi:hypothetical protein